MQTHLVTGGAGFIGSHLVRALLEKGASVRVLDNFSTGKSENLQGLDGRIQVLEADLRDIAAVARAVEGVDTIFHQAAFISVPESMETPQLCFDINLNGTAILLDAARKVGVRRVVLASSSAVYGESTKLPLSEATPLEPRSPYALSKEVNELYARLFTSIYGLEVVALRYFNVYGPRQNRESMYAAAVPIFIHRLMIGKPIQVFGDGGQTRDLIYIRDVVQANLFAAEHAKAAGQVFNICTGIETRLLDLLEVLFGLFPGYQPPEFTIPRPGDIYRSVGDCRKAADELGFQAQITLADGIRETVEWIRHQ